MIKYLCISLRIIGLVWPTRLVLLAMGEVLSFGFNLAVSLPSDRKENNYDDIQGNDQVYRHHVQD